MSALRRRLGLSLLAGVFLAIIGVGVSWEMGRMRRVAALKDVYIHAGGWDGPWGEGFAFAGQQWLATPTHVEIYSGPLDPEGRSEAEALRSLASLPRLRAAMVGRLQMGEDDFRLGPGPWPGLPARLKALCANPSLENLTFCDITPTAEGWSALSAPGPMARLRSLQFHAVPMGLGIYSMLAGMTELRQLTLLPVTRVTDDHVAALTAGPGLRKLTELRLRKNSRHLTTACIPHLARLPALKKLILEEYGSARLPGSERLPGLSKEDLQKALPGVVVTGN